MYGLVNVDQLFVVTFYQGDAKPPTYTSDKTNSEIYAAHTAGKVVVAKYDNTWLSLGNNIRENFATFFSLILSADAGDATIQQFTIFSDTVTRVQGEIAVSPVSD